MLPVYSVRFASTHNLDTYLTWACPDGFTAVATSAWVYSGPMADITNCLLGWAVPGVDQVVISNWFSSGEETAFLGNWQGRHVIFPGEEIFFQAVSGVWDVNLSGFFLAGVPPTAFVPAGDRA